MDSNIASHKCLGMTNPWIQIAHSAHLGFLRRSHTTTPSGQKFLFIMRFWVPLFWGAQHDSLIPSPIHNPIHSPVYTLSTAPSALPLPHPFRSGSFTESFGPGSKGPVVMLAAALSAVTFALWSLKQLVHQTTPTSDVAMAAVVGIAADRSVKNLLKTYADEVAALAKRTEDVRDPEEHDDIWIMRFAAANDGDIDAAEEDIRHTIAWRTGEGKPIVDAAKNGIAQATAQGLDKWDNAPVLSGAPNSAIVSKYITESNLLTISTQDTEVFHCPLC